MTQLALLAGAVDSMREAQASLEEVITHYPTRDTTALKLGRIHSELVSLTVELHEIYREALGI